MAKEKPVVKKIPVTRHRLAKGRREYLAIKRGESVSARAALGAKCYECMSFYEDGVGDCGCVECPIHSFMPYNPKPVKRRRKKVAVDK